MASKDNPYSRFYWRFRDEYADVYADKEAFGWWLTLLANAEGAHPSAPELPRKIKPTIIAKLVGAGLLTVLPDDRYRLLGVAAEIKRRSSQGIAGADARWNRTQSEGNANAMPRREEKRLDEKRIASIGKAVDEEVPFVALTKEQQAEALQREQDELMKKIGWKVGVAE